MNNPNVRLPDEIKVRCTAPRTDYFGKKFTCNWEGTEADLEWVETFPGRWFGDPPLPPEGEAVCPECRRWEFIEDIDGEQDGNENDEEG